MVAILAPFRKLAAGVLYSRASAPALSRGTENMKEQAHKAGVRVDEQPPTIPSTIF